MQWLNRATLRLLTENTLDREEKIMAEQFTTLASLTVDGKGSYGIGASAVPFSKDLYTYLRITDIKDDGTLNLKGLKSVDDEKASEYILKPNDIVFARTGASTGRNYFYDGMDGEFVYAGFLIKFSIDEKKVNPKYIKYFCQSKQYKDWINSFNTGSTRGNINAQTLGKMPIPLIERTTQDALVNILSSIDEKIKKNNEINNNLEQQAIAIFNNAIEQSKSVTYAELGSLADVKGGKRLPKGANLMSIPNSHPYIRVRDLNDVVFASLSANYEYVDDETQKTISRYITTTDDVLISTVGTIGLTAIVDKSLNMANLTENCVKVTNLHGISPEYLLLYLRSQHGSEEIKKGTVGAVQAKLPIKNIQALSVPLLPQSDLQSLNDTLKVLFNQLSINVAESKCLTDIRDSLLPKLMSGELDVSNLDL